jgi:TRAP-type C4-dicarboxylate transport system permease small subunit
MARQNGAAARHGARIDAAILFVTRALLWLAALCIGAMLAIIVGSVVMRYAISRPLAFTEELTGLLLATSIFLTLPHVTAAHLNIRVTLVADRLGGVARRVAHGAGQLALVVFLVLFAVEAQKLVGFAFRFNERTELTRLPIAPFKIAMVASLYVTLVIALWQALRPPPVGDGLRL